MNVPHDDARWVDRATALLDATADNLDAATLSRLNRARQAALAAQPVRWRPWTVGAGLAGAAAAMLAIAVGLHVAAAVAAVARPERLRVAPLVHHWRRFAAAVQTIRSHRKPPRVDG